MRSRETIAIPVYCSFSLNNRETSTFVRSGFGAIEAYSGHGKGRDNPNDVADIGVGAIPPGTYYLIDRQSGGRLGWFRDTFGPWFGTTDRREWFMLWNAHGGEITNVNGIKRGNFRLHPDGPMHESDGCITVLHQSDFDRLQHYIRAYKPDMSVPGSDLKAYGRVEVR